jgi:hypothetical protein
VTECLPAILTRIFDMISKIKSLPYHKKTNNVDLSIRALTLLGLRLVNKLGEAAFTATASIRMFSHEYPLSTPWAISLFSDKFLIGHFIKLKNLCLPAFFLICTFQIDPPYSMPIYSRTPTYSSCPILTILMLPASPSILQLFLHQ